MQELIRVTHFLEQNAIAVQAFAAMATLLLTAILTYATVRYVRLTADSNQLTREQLKLAQQQLGAAVEATEALQRPVIMIRQQPRPGEDVILDGPHAAQVLQAPEVQLINVGLGTALNLRYQFLQVDVENEAPRIDCPGVVPRLAAGHTWHTALARGALPTRNFNFTATYESLSHTRYQTTMRIELGVIVDSRFNQIAG